MPTTFTTSQPGLSGETLYAVLSRSGVVLATVAMDEDEPGKFVGPVPDGIAAGTLTVTLYQQRGAEPSPATDWYMGGGVVVHAGDAPPGSASREDRVVEAAVADLIAAGLVARAGLPWTVPAASGSGDVAWVEWERTDEEDRSRESKVMACRLSLWLAAEAGGADDGRRRAARLLAVAREALGGSSLGGLVEPAHTRVVGSRALPGTDGGAYAIESAVRCRWTEADGARDTAPRVLAI